MEKVDKIIAIQKTLPGLEGFLKEVLGKECLSSEAEEKRQEFLKILDTLYIPPSLPPRPKTLPKKNTSSTQAIPSGSSPEESPTTTLVRRSFDPVAFASQQREISRFYANKADLDVGIGVDTETAQELIPPQRPRKSSGDGDDDSIYEHLSLSGDTVSTPPPTNSSTDGSVNVPQSPIKTEGEASSFGTSPYGTLHGRSGSLRLSGGRARLTSVWFKKDPKVNIEIYGADLPNPTLAGYLKELKTNKKRWCVIKDQRLYIFKNQEEQAFIIVDLAGCNINVDDKKKISYSFKLSKEGMQPVVLAVEEGEDLSPWVSAIMAAVVSKPLPTNPYLMHSSPYQLQVNPLYQARAQYQSPKPVPPENPYKLTPEEQKQTGRRMPRDQLPSLPNEEEVHDEQWDSDESSSSSSDSDSDCEDLHIYERPVEGWFLKKNQTSTPNKEDEIPVQDAPESDEDGLFEYTAPLPPLPLSDEASVSESETIKSPASPAPEKAEKTDEPVRTEEEKEIMETTPDKEPSQGLKSRRSGVFESPPVLDYFSNDNEDKIKCGVFDSGFTDSATCSTPGSTGDRKRSSSDLRSLGGDSKRSSAFMSNTSLSSLEADMSSYTSPLDSMVFSEGVEHLKSKKERFGETELKFLQDPLAAHSGVLLQKRMLGVWIKRFCKIADNRLKCFRQPDDTKPIMDRPLLGYEVSVADNREARKNYSFKLWHPKLDTLFFAADSRISMERWIEMLSLAATGRLEFVSPTESHQEVEPVESLPEKDDFEHIYDNVVEALDALVLSGAVSLEENGTTSSHGTDEPDAGYDTEDSRENQNSTGTTTSPVPPKRTTSKNRRSVLSTSSASKESSDISPELPSSPTILDAVSGFLEIVDEQQKLQQVAAELEKCKDKEPVSETLPSKPEEEKKPESQEKQPQQEEKEKKGWTDSVRKHHKLKRKSSLDMIKLRARSLTSSTSSMTLPQPKQSKLSSSKRRAITNRLATLLDNDEGFSSYLTEVRVTKMSKTTIRRWCTIKNGVFCIYSNNHAAEKALNQLQLASSKVIDSADPNKGQFSFAIESDNGHQVFTFQTSKKEEFEKWLSILTLSEELYRHYAARDEKKRHGKRHEISGSESKGKDDAKVDNDADNKSNGSHSSIELDARLDQEHRKTLTAETLSSLRKKITPRKTVNGRKQSYDFNSGELDINGLYRPKLVTDSILTMFNEDGSYTGYTCNFVCKTDGRSADYSKQWCVVKEGKLHVYNDDNLETPLRTIILKGCNLTGVTDCGKSWYCFRLEPLEGPPATFHVQDKNELYDWITVISIATELSGDAEPTEDNIEKIVEKLETAQTFTDKTRSLRLKFKSIKSPENSLVLRRHKKKSVSVEALSPTVGKTDGVVQGYLQEIHATHLSRTLHVRWCVLNEGFLQLHENERTEKSLRVISVSDAKITNESNVEKKFFGFKLEHGTGQCSRFKASSKEDLDKWINAFKIAQEKYSSSQVKLRDKTSRTGREMGIVNEAFGEAKTENDSTAVKRRSLNRSIPIERRFSCGSLLDSEGKYCGYLTEIRIRHYCRTEIRRWCMAKNRVFYIYDGDRGTSLVKTILLDDASLIDESDFSVDVYCFKLEYGEEQLMELHAPSRGEFEKWVTVIAVAIYIGKNRLNRAEKPDPIMEDSQLSLQECEKRREEDRNFLVEKEKELLNSVKTKSSGLVRQPSLVEERKQQFESAHFFPRKSPRDIQEKIKSLQEEKVALKDRLVEMRTIYSEVKKSKARTDADGNKEMKDQNFKDIRGDLTTLKRHIGDIEGYLSQLETELNYITGQENEVHFKSPPHSKSSPLSYSDENLTRQHASSVTSDGSDVVVRRTVSMRSRGADAAARRGVSVTSDNSDTIADRTESVLSEGSWNEIVRSHSVSITQSSMDKFLREHTKARSDKVDEKGIIVDGHIYEDLRQHRDAADSSQHASENEPMEELVNEKDCSFDESAFPVDSDVPYYENVPVEFSKTVNVHLKEDRIIRSFITEIIKAVLYELEEEVSLSRTSHVGMTVLDTSGLTSPSASEDQSALDTSGLKEPTGMKDPSGLDCLSGLTSPSASKDQSALDTSGLSEPTGMKDPSGLDCLSDLTSPSASEDQSALDNSFSLDGTSVLDNMSSLVNPSGPDHGSGTKQLLVLQDLYSVKHSSTSDHRSAAEGQEGPSGVDRPCSLDDLSFPDETLDSPQAKSLGNSDRSDVEDSDSDDSECSYDLLSHSNESLDNFHTQESQLGLNLGLEAESKNVNLQGEGSCGLLKENEVRNDELEVTESILEVFQITEEKINMQQVETHEECGTDRPVVVVVVTEVSSTDVCNDGSEVTPAKQAVNGMEQNIEQESFEEKGCKLIEDSQLTDVFSNDQVCCATEPAAVVMNTELLGESTNISRSSCESESTIEDSYDLISKSTERLNEDILSNLCETASVDLSTVEPHINIRVTFDDDDNDAEMERIIVAEPSQVKHEARLDAVVIETTRVSETRMELNFSEHEVIDMEYSDVFDTEVSENSQVIQTEVDVSLTSCETVGAEHILSVGDEDIEITQVEIISAEEFISHQEIPPDDNVVVEQDDVHSNESSVKQCECATDIDMTESRDIVQLEKSSKDYLTKVQNKLDEPVLMVKQEEDDETVLCELTPPGVEDIVSQALRKAMNKVDLQSCQTTEHCYNMEYKDFTHNVHNYGIVVNETNNKDISNSEVSAELPVINSEDLDDNSDNEDSHSSPSSDSSPQHQHHPNSLHAPLAYEEALSEFEASEELPSNNVYNVGILNSSKDHREQTSNECLSSVAHVSEIKDPRTITDLSVIDIDNTKCSDTNDTLQMDIDLASWEILDTRF